MEKPSRSTLVRRCPGPVSGWARSARAKRQAFFRCGFVVPEMVEVLTRIGRVLDSHSEPSLAVPEDSITKNPQTGESSFDASLKIFPIGEGQRLPQYIEWEGQMEASFKELEFLMNQFYTVSET